MKKIAVILITLFCLSAGIGFAQTPFEVNNAGSQAQKKLVAADSDNSGPSTGTEKEVKGFFKILKGVLDVLKAIVEGIMPAAAADEIDEMSATNATDQAAGKLPANIAGTAATGVDKNTLAGSTPSNGATVAVASSEKAVVASAGKAPAAETPASPAGKAVTIGSAKFKEWFKAAAGAYCPEWEFPDVTNKYGEKISREDYMRAIIWIESRGIHQSPRGVLTKSWAGAQGFMQLMPNTARGLKIDPKDPAQNLKGGAKYLAEIFNSGAVSKKTGAEKLIMGACAYNLGPFSKSMKLSWNELKASRKIPTETRGYGLKLKMCLGLELTADERELVNKWLVGPGQTVDSLIAENYTNTKGIAR